MNSRQEYLEDAMYSEAGNACGVQVADMSHEQSPIDPTKEPSHIAVNPSALSPELDEPQHSPEGLYVPDLESQTASGFIFRHTELVWSFGSKLDIEVSLRVAGVRWKIGITRLIITAATERRVC